MLDYFPCTYEFTIKEELMKHMIDKHDKANGAAEGLEIYIETLSGTSEDDRQFYDLGEDAEDSAIASELKKMAMQYGYKGPCHECKMANQVNDHQAEVIKALESKLESI